MKFNAGEQVERLDWDFKAFGGGEGTVPEPSTGAVNHFFKQIKEMAQGMREMREAGAKIESGELSEEEAADEIAQMSDDVLETYIGQLNKALAELCQDSPNEEQLGKLPYRVQTAFMQWLMGQFRPEQQGPVTRR